MQLQLRIARPVRDLALAKDMYCRGLGLVLLGEFADHDGFDGVLLGRAGSSYHLEFTISATDRVLPTPTPEDLLVLYQPDRAEWQSLCQNMLAAGFKLVASFNPYWETRGRTFEDQDGYRIVLQNAAWSSE